MKNEIKRIEVVHEHESFKFETRVNAYLSEGYILLNTHILPNVNSVRYVAIMGKPIYEKS